MELTPITPLFSLHCFPFNKTENILENARFTNRNLNFAFLTYLLLLLIVFVKASNVHRKYEASIIFSCSLLISLIAFPLLLGLAFVFTLYRQIIGLILKIKLKDNFGGLLHGTDSVWAIEDQSKSIVNILMLIESDYDSEKFYYHIKHSLQEIIFESSLCLPKLSATFHQAFGYFYLRKNNITIDNCVKPIKINSDEKAKLMIQLSTRCNLSLPKGHSAFWEILVGDNKVKWRDHKKFYPVIFRVHHSLTDGISLLGILTNLFSNSSSSHKDYVKQELGIRGKLKMCARNLYAILSAPVVIFLQMSRSPDCNKLHGPMLSDQKILAVKVENKPFSIGIIKKIKKNLVDDGFTFSDILLTAVSAGFREYFEKNSLSKPKSLTAVVLSYPRDCVNSTNLTLKNQFSLAMMNLPLDKCTKSYYRDTLWMVNKEARRLKGSNDYQ
ncbi:hypothetical protein ILUMI_20044, partial [Ignelater luminosus]